MQRLIKPDSPYSLVLQQAVSFSYSRAQPFRAAAEQTGLKPVVLQQAGSDGRSRPDH